MNPWVCPKCGRGVRGDQTTCDHGDGGSIGLGAKPNETGYWPDRYPYAPAWDPRNPSTWCVGAGSGAGTGGTH